MIVENELIVRGNLPAATRKILQRIGAPLTNTVSKESPRQLGFMAGEIKVPDDFDSMGDSESEKI